MGYLKGGRWYNGEPNPDDFKPKRLDEMGTSGCWLDIEIYGKTDYDGVTPVTIKYLEHASTGFVRDLDMPGWIVCDADEFWFLDEIFTEMNSSITTYTKTPKDGEIIRYWELMAGDPSFQQYLDYCHLKTAQPIRAFTYEEVYGWR